jgi:hypothetical protein
LRFFARQQITQGVKRLLSNLLRKLANNLGTDRMQVWREEQMDKEAKKLEEQIQELQAALLPALRSAEKSAPDWTQEHQGVLKRFVESPSGAALVARLEATSYLNFTAMGPDGAEIRADQAARAVGYHDCIRHIESLSRVSLRDNEEKNALAGEGEPELSERLTP